MFCGFRFRCNYNLKIDALTNTCKTKKNTPAPYERKRVNLRVLSFPTRARCNVVVVVVAPRNPMSRRSRCICCVGEVRARLIAVGWRRMRCWSGGAGECVCVCVLRSLCRNSIRLLDNMLVYVCVLEHR